MSAPSQHPEAKLPLKDGLIIAFALVVAALTMMIWRQRAEIRQLSQRAAPPALAVRVQAAAARSLRVGPAQPVPEHPGELRLTGEADEHGSANRGAGAIQRPRQTDALAQLLNNVEFRHALEMQRQAVLDVRFAGLFRLLKLGDDELATFKQLLAEKESVLLDVVAVSDALPDGPLPPEAIGTGVMVARQQVEDAIRAALGSERYAVYHEYEQTLPQRTVVAQLERRLSYSPTPLTPAQSDSLVHILAAHAPPAETGNLSGAAVVVSPGSHALIPLAQADGPVASITEAAVAESQTVLAPPQVAALRNLQVEQQASMRAFQLIQDGMPISDNPARSWLRHILE